MAGASHRSLTMVLIILARPTLNIHITVYYGLNDHKRLSPTIKYIIIIDIYSDNI